jgi:hypothetical protein
MVMQRHAGNLRGDEAERLAYIGGLPHADLFELSDTLDNLYVEADSLDDAKQALENVDSELIADELADLRTVADELKATTTAKLTKADLIEAIADAEKRLRDVADAMEKALDDEGKTNMVIAQNLAKLDATLGAMQ